MPNPLASENHVLMDLINVIYPRGSKALICSLTGLPPENIPKEPS